VKLEDVAAIVRDGNDFQRFQARLQTLATELGFASVTDEQEHGRQVQVLVETARTEWESYRRQLGSYGRIFIETATDEATKAVVGTTASVGLGAATFGLVGMGAGLFVGHLRCHRGAAQTDTATKG